MVLTQEDKDWFKQALDASMSSMSKTVSALGKRVVRAEQAFEELSRVSRMNIVASARKEHAKLVQEMFNGSDILAVPSLVDNGDGGRTRGAVSCDQQTVAQFFRDYEGDYEVELAPKLGFRLVHQSRSAQKRRKDGASVLKHAKENAKNSLKLHLQYDKPFQLREIQGKAQKFLGTLKREGKELISSVSAKGGYLYANDVRLAPEYLVPESHRWSSLVGQILVKIRGWGTRVPISPEFGVLHDVFGAEFAADRGVVDINEIPIEEDELMQS
jgi:hypothetical protein